MNDAVPARKEIQIGQRVWAVEKRNYASGRLTEGVVQRILTSKTYHPRGIKVMFEDGTVARVQRLTPPDAAVASGTSEVAQSQSTVEFDEEFDLR